MTHRLEVFGLSLVGFLACEYRALLPAIASHTEITELLINYFDPIAYRLNGQPRRRDEYAAGMQEFFDDAMMNTHNFDLSAETLRVLKPLENLTQLYLVLPLGFTGLTNRLLDEVLQCWSRLEHLSLIPQLAFPSEKRRTFPLQLTLRAFISLATHCPLLRLAGIVVDARTAPSTELFDLALKTPIRPQLFHLDVSDSPIKHSKKVARFLSCLFPRARHISSHIHLASLWSQHDPEIVAAAELNEQAARWDVVQGLIGHMAEIWEHVEGKSWKNMKVNVEEDDLW
ncbi:hypothetical protein C8F01DRAFT_1338782 [Mycena amicta]|nr:hypothetical protein C8F01DRAFT_1338782 [Mycena amicta]